MLKTQKKKRKKNERTGGELSINSEFGYSQHWIIWVILVFVFLSQSTYANTQITHTRAHTHGNTHTHFTMLSLLKAYGRNLIYFPNVSEACSQVSPLNPCWYKKRRVSQTKPNAELEILKNFQPRHLEETIKGNKSARGGKKNISGNIDMNNKCKSRGAFNGFSLWLATSLPGTRACAHAHARVLTYS